MVLHFLSILQLITCFDFINRQVLNVWIIPFFLNLFGGKTVGINVVIF